MPGQRLHTLSKEERLSGKTGIDALLGKGRWASTEDIRYCFLRREEGGLNRILVSVPKRSFKRAVRRNLLKRRMREAYRTRKDLLPPCGTDLLMVWSCPEVKPYEDICAQVGRILQDLSRKISGQ